MTTKFSFKYGMTINIGDYSNVRPELGFQDMEVPVGHDPLDYIQTWLSQVINKVHQIADDELEANGRIAQYCREPLYQLHVSHSRQCIVIHPVITELPRESTWKESDIWNTPNAYELSDNFPSYMRYQTAHRFMAYLKERHPDYTVRILHNDDFSTLPPLPDPGPEPLWHKKDLESHLKALNIADDMWDAVAALEYVDLAYLSEVLDLTREGWNKPAQLKRDDAIHFILENRPFPPDPITDTAEDEDDWDEDDDDDDAPF